MTVFLYSVVFRQLHHFLYSALSGTRSIKLRTRRSCFVWTFLKLLFWLQFHLFSRVSLTLFWQRLASSDHDLTPIQSNSVSLSFWFMYIHNSFRVGVGCDFKRSLAPRKLFTEFHRKFSEMSSLWLGWLTLKCQQLCFIISYFIKRIINSFFITMTLRCPHSVILFRHWIIHQVDTSLW